MFKATKEIYEALAAQNLNVFVKENEDSSMVSIGFSINYSAPVEICFISKDDDNDVAVRVDLMRVEEDKLDMLAPLLNAFNCKYRYAKFTITEGNDVFIEYDFPIKGCNLGECAKEMLVRFVKIVREVHPELLRAMLV